MSIDRRFLLKGAAAYGLSLPLSQGLHAQTAPSVQKTLRMVKQGDLRVFDPIWTTANITADHGTQIFDTLFSLDADYKPQPQMVGRWNVSDDKLTYTFELRDGLGWHDGTPVKAADCVASIRRWGQVDPGGRAIMARASDISKKDDKTFVIVLKEPFPLLIDVMAKLSPPCLFIMREKDAEKPASEQVTSNIGSGPFIFNQALARPGASFTYDRNPHYVARSESPSGLAGGKVAKVDRVVWNNIADAQTAMSALQAGEVDYIAAVNTDLIPALEQDPNIKIEILMRGGYDAYIRMNFLQKPFNNPKVRQAVLHAIDQESLMRAAFGDPKYYKSLVSIFGNETLYTNDENTGWFTKGGNLAKATELVKSSGYAGEKVVLLHTTNIPWMNDAALVVASQLRKIGLNVELASSDWGGVVTRRNNKGPVTEGGWSMFLSSDSDFSRSDPLASSFLQANGEQAWYGWPQNEAYEALRAEWPRTTSVEDRKVLARKMQNEWWNFVGAINLGQQLIPSAYRRNVSGFLSVPGIVPVWNVSKS